MSQKSVQACCHMLSPIFSKEPWAPTNRIPAPLETRTFQWLLCFVCICTTRGGRKKQRGRQRMAVACCGFCVGAAALEAAEQWSVWWNRLRSEQTALNGNVWFGLGCLWTDGTALQRGKFNKRWSEKLETVRGRERKTDRTHLYFIPGWFESLRNKRITLDGLNVLYPSHLLLQRSSLWNTCNTEDMNKSTHTRTQTHTCVSANPCHVLKGTRFHVDWAMALYNALWHIQYQISDIPLF